MPSTLTDASSQKNESQVLLEPALHHKHQHTSLQEPSDTYTWTQHKEYPFGDSFMSESVPVINLNDPNALQLIGHACKTWGVFQVTNHNIPVSLFDNIEHASRSLFSLPTQQKLKAARSPDGHSGYGFARISSLLSKPLCHEGFTNFGSPLEQFCKLWPQDYSKYCDIVEEYKEEMKMLAGKLMWLMLGSLGISMEDIKWAGPKGDFKEAGTGLQLNYYPVSPDPEQALGLAAHTDAPFFVILYQNKTSGLQVLKEGARWVTVPPVPGALVVNLGDLLHILSNGSYPNVLHQATVNQTQERLSIAYLYGPPNGVQISPLPKLVDPSHPPLYQPVTWPEYLDVKAKHFNEALSLFRICAPLNVVANEVI